MQRLKGGADTQRGEVTLLLLLSLELLADQEFQRVVGLSLRKYRLKSFRISFVSKFDYEKAPPNLEEFFFYIRKGKDL